MELVDGMLLQEGTRNVEGHGQPSDDDRLTREEGAAPVELEAEGQPEDAKGGPLLRCADLLESQDQLEVARAEAQGHHEVLADGAPQQVAAVDHGVAWGLPQCDSSIVTVVGQGEGAAGVADPSEESMGRPGHTRLT